MVKPITVPSSNVLRDDTVSDASETNNTPSLSSETNIPAQKQQSSTSAPNGTVNGLQHIKQKSKVSSIAARAMAALNDDGSSDSDSDEDNISASALENAKEASGVHETNNTTSLSSDTNNIPTIDFSDVFNELQKYKEENNGSLSIPTSHCTLSNIVDSLSKPSIDIESLANQRWDGHLNKLIEYMKSKKKYTDINTLVSKSTWYKKQPKLVEWVDIQRQQCKLYSQEDDDCVLTKKRAKKLKRLGFDIGKEEKSSKDEVPPSNGRESKKRSNPSQEDTSTRKKIKVEDDALLMKQESTDVEDMVKVDQEDTIPADDEMKVAADIKKTNIQGKCDVCEKKDGYLRHILRQCRCCRVLVHGKLMCISFVHKICCKNESKPSSFLIKLSIPKHIEACYGIPATDGKDRYFTCRACGAMGVDIEVNVPSKIGGTGKKMGKKHEKMRQIGRPRECVLCSHNKGTHAMHPLLDVHGKEGRQLVWRGHDGGEKRLAWVHTLCAGLISGNRATDSCVYGKFLI